MEGAHQVHLQRAPEDLDGFVDRGNWNAESCVVDEDVESAEAIQRVRDDLVDVDAMSAGTGITRCSSPAKASRRWARRACACRCP